MVHSLVAMDSLPLSVFMTLSSPLIYRLHEFPYIFGAIPSRKRHKNQVHLGSPYADNPTQVAGALLKSECHKEWRRPLRAVAPCL